MRHTRSRSPMRSSPTRGAALGLLALACTVTVPATGTCADDPAKIYEKQCASCHGMQGKGDGPAAKLLKTKPHDFTDAAWAKATRDEDLIKAVKGGGVAVGKDKLMPAFPKLSDEEVQALVKIVRGFGAGM